MNDYAAFLVELAAGIMALSLSLAMLGMMVVGIRELVRYFQGKYDR